MTDILQRIVQALPSMTQWIDELLEQHVANAKPVADSNLPRLLSYYPSAILTAARVVQVSAFPSPPVEKFGLPEFLPFATMPLAGVTYRDMFFVRESDRSEALYFHELVHVVQWEALGVNAFLLTYGAGLTQFEYERSPLEAIAYAAQARFEAGAPIPNLVATVAQHAHGAHTDALALYARRGVPVSSIR